MRSSTQRSWKRLLYTAALVMAGLTLWVTLVEAETVVEAWRVGGFEWPLAVAPNTTDNSCLVADSDEVICLNSDGSERWRTSGFNFPIAWENYASYYSVLSISPWDGTFWIADSLNAQVCHLGTDGVELWRSAAFPGYTYAISLAPDGSYYVADSNLPIGWPTPNPGHVYRFSSNGTLLWSRDDYSDPVSLSTFWPDNSCWVADEGIHYPGLHWVETKVQHLDSNGDLMMEQAGLWSSRIGTVSVNEYDGSCWVLDANFFQAMHRVLHFSPGGALTWEFDNLNSPECVSVNYRDSSGWVSDYYPNQVVHLDKDGAELWRGGSFNGPAAVAANPRDGSCFVIDLNNDEVVKLAVVDFPKAAFVATPMSGSAPLTVKFENWSLGTPTSCLWDFGDGTTSLEDNPTHTYTSARNYNVTLTVSNECGEDSECMCIEVKPPQCATRTPGYWFTHPEALLEAFEAITGEEWGTIYSCPPSGCGVTPEDAMAIFWRMRGQRATFAKHILAAMFNDALLKPAPDVLIEEALEVLCDPDSTNEEISNVLRPLASYNGSGDWLPMNGLNFGNADPSQAKEMAAIGTAPGCVQSSDSLRKNRLLTTKTRRTR